MCSCDRTIITDGNGRMDFDSEWTAFKNQTFAFGCTVIVFLLVLLTGYVVTVAFVCRRWLNPRHRSSSQRASSSCCQPSSPSANHCSCSEKSLLAPTPSSDKKGEPGPTRPNKDRNGLPANYSANHVQIMNAGNDRACPHTDRCVGLIGLTCSCSQGDRSPSLVQETGTKSLED